MFTPDGDPASEAWFAEQGINHVYVPPAVVSDECTVGNYRPELDHDVIFVGSKHYHPEWPHRGELLAWLEATYGDRFKRYGGDVQVMRGQDLNDLYASAKVVVGDSLCLPGHTRYWSDRYYETVGRGGFLIAPCVPGIEEHFTDGEHLLFYDFWRLRRAAPDDRARPQPTPTLRIQIQRRGQSPRHGQPHLRPPAPLRARTAPMSPNRLAGFVGVYLCGVMIGFILGRVFA